jgi:hypothetical protein
MTKRFHMNRTAQLALITGLMALAAGLANAQAPRCSVLTGTYAFTFNGAAVFPGSPNPVPFNGVGVQTFDGSGKWTGTESANFGAFVLRSVPFSGTYTLNPDCTGTATAKFPDGTTGRQDFVVTDGGKMIYAIGVDNTGPGTWLATTFTKMPVTW